MLNKLGEFAVNELCSRVPGKAASGCPSEVGPALRPADSYGNLKWSACKKRFFIRARESLFFPFFPLLFFGESLFYQMFPEKYFQVLYLSPWHTGFRQCSGVSCSEWYYPKKIFETNRNLKNDFLTSPKRSFLNTASGCLKSSGRFFHRYFFVKL